MHELTELPNTATDFTEYDNKARITKIMNTFLEFLKSNNLVLKFQV